MPVKKTLNDLANEARAKVPEIEVEDLEEDYKDAIVVDVREPDERARGFIAGSIHVPRGVIERDIERAAFNGNAGNADLERPIVCYCGGGSRSLLAARSLQEMGFTQAVSLRGGMGAWGRSGRPIEIARA